MPPKHKHQQLDQYELNVSKARWLLDVADVDWEESWGPEKLETLLRLYVGSPGDVNAFIEDIQRHVWPL